MKGYCLTPVQHPNDEAIVLEIGDEIECSDEHFAQLIELGAVSTEKPAIAKAKTKAEPVA